MKSTTRDFAQILLLLLFCTVTLNCSSDLETLDSETLPYKLETVHFVEHLILPADLDLDGQDELVYYGDRLGPKGGGAILMKTGEGGIIGQGQVNFKEPITKPHVLDVDGDGIQEVLVPFVRSDSLYARVVDNQGEKKQLLFLATGTPRADKDGQLVWDSDVSTFLLANVDEDADNELVSVIHTKYARLPRGLVVHDLPSGRFIDKSIIGAPVNSPILDDFDGDGHQEVVFSSNTPDNGAMAGGMSDMRSYIGMFDLVPAPDITWKKDMGGRQTTPWHSIKDFDGDGSVELLTTVRKKYEASSLQLRDPGSGTVILERKLTYPIRSITVVNLDQDEDQEILLIDYSGTLVVFDHRLEGIRRLAMGPDARGVFSRPDLDGDGVDEVFLITPSRFILLDPDLRLKAIGPAEPRGLIRRGQDRSPYLYAFTTHKETYILRLAVNRFYLIKRYGPSILRGGVLGVFILLCIIIAELYAAKVKAQQLIEEAERKLEEAKQLIIQLKQNAPLDEEEDRLAQVYTIIGKQYSNSAFGVAELAYEMGWSSRTLQRFLKDKIDKKPLDLIREIRLKHAKALINEQGSAIRVSEIAYSTGFKNPGHFTRCFKKAYGLSPTKYIKTKRLADSP